MILKTSWQESDKHAERNESDWLSSSVTLIDYDRVRSHTLRCVLLSTWVTSMYHRKSMTSCVKSSLARLKTTSTGEPSMKPSNERSALVNLKNKLMLPSAMAVHRLSTVMEKRTCQPTCHSLTTSCRSSESSSPERDLIANHSSSHGTD